MSANRESLTVFLGTALRNRLETTAEKYKRPMAELVRAALMHYLKVEENK